MLSLARRISATRHRILVRQYAEVTSTKTASKIEYPKLNERVPVKENHGLYSFFRRKEGVDLTGDARFEVVETPDSARVSTGRGWKASELRLKSFEDLHTLWYILLRERNLLATQKEEARRMGVNNSEIQVSADKVHQCRKSMARIKAVLNERRLAYEGAIRLAEKQKDNMETAAVIQEQATAFKRGRQLLSQSRKAKEISKSKTMEMDETRMDAVMEQSTQQNTTAAKSFEDEPNTMSDPGDSNQQNSTRTSEPDDIAVTGVSGNVQTESRGQQ